MRSLIHGIQRNGIALAYGIGIIAAGSVYHFLSAADREHLLASVSTNVHNLQHRPVFVLLASIFWVIDTSVPYWVFAGAIGLACCQRAFGWKWTLFIVLGAHVLATLITQAVMWWMVRHGYQPSSHLREMDVGPSYVVVAALVCAVVRAKGLIRIVATVTLAPVAISLLIAIPHWDLADSGHLITAVLVLLGLFMASRQQATMRSAT